MGDTGAHIDVTDGQIEQVNLVRWLLSPNTKATQSKARMKSPSKKQNGLNEMTTESSGNVAPATETTAATTIKPVKIISCIQCQSRKIKCDKVKPACGHCIKSKIGFCEYRPPATPRRGKRKLTEADLLLRLRGHEDLLRDSGFEIDEDGNVNRATRPSVSQGDAKPPIKKRHTLRESSNGTNTSTADLSIKCDGRSTGEIIVEEDGSRYVESDLWRGIGAMVHSPSQLRFSTMI